MQGKGTQSGPAQALEQNRAAISKLAQSGDAQRLMELLRQGGGVEQGGPGRSGGGPGGPDGHDGPPDAHPGGGGAGRPHRDPGQAGGTGVTD